MPILLALLGGVGAGLYVSKQTKILTALVLAGGAFYFYRKVK